MWMRFCRASFNGDGGVATVNDSLGYILYRKDQLASMWTARLPPLMATCRLQAARYAVTRFNGDGGFTAVNGRFGQSADFSPAFRMLSTADK